MFCDNDRKGGWVGVVKQDEKSNLLKVWVCVCIGFCKGALRVLPPTLQPWQSLTGSH